MRFFSTIFLVFVSLIAAYGYESDFNEPPNFEFADRDPMNPMDPVIINVIEDAGQQSIIGFLVDINPGIADPGPPVVPEVESYRFIVEVISSTSNLAFDNLSIDNQGVLRYKTTDDTNGTGTIQVTMEDKALNTKVDQFTIEVAPINDRPIFTSGPDIELLEDAGLQSFAGWATGIGPGGGDDELSQTLSFQTDIVGVVNGVTFKTAPAINANGDLTFEAGDDDFGTVTLNVTLFDDGSDVAPNDNESITQSFIIEILPVNDPPAFVMPDTLIAQEDDGSVLVTKFVSEITVGPDNESDQSLNFFLTIDSLSEFLTFNTTPQIFEDGSISFEADPDANGVALITVTGQDSGPGDPPDENTAVNSLVLIITPVNDPPSFEKSNDIVIDEDEIGSFPEWAFNLSPGPPDEADQTLTFTVNQTGSIGSIGFDVGPLISSTGTLDFQTTANTNGQATFEIFLMDSGPSDGDNNNTSTRRGLTISVNAVNDPPVFTPGPDQNSDENAGFIAIPDWATNIGPGGGEDELEQGIEFVIEPIEFNGNLGFALGPFLEIDGTLSYQSTTNTFGSAQFLITLVDDGPTDPPNNPISESHLLTITINEVNNPPNDIRLSNNRVEELREPGTLVGTLQAIDPDDETHTFSLVSGAGSADNANFTIEGDQLLTAVELSFDLQVNHNIRVSASDGENTFETNFIVEVVRQPVDGITFANAFTPNGDGENDVWVLENIEFFPASEISIFNKNGQRVFNSQGYRTEWDGKQNGNDLPVDSYYYIIDLKNDTEVLKGTVTIIR